MPELNYMGILNDISIEDQYKEYLTQHINNVRKGYEWCLENMPELFTKINITLFEQLIDKHDASKYSKEEFLPYAQYFYGKKTDKVKKDFEYAWLHHQKENPHHHQYWTLINDEDGITPLEMPYYHILEMVFDHWSFSWNSHNLNEIFSWYENNKDNMLLHQKTRDEYETILGKLKNKIKEIEG